MRAPIYQLANPMAISADMPKLGKKVLSKNFVTLLSAGSPKILVDLASTSRLHLRTWSRGTGCSVGMRINSSGLRVGMETAEAIRSAGQSDPFGEEASRVGTEIGGIPPPPIETDKAFEEATHNPAASKTGGRRRYTRTTEHFTQRLYQLISIQGVSDPIQVLTEISIGKRIVQMSDGSHILTPFDGKPPDHKTRAIAAAELLSYAYPKRKSVEVSGLEGSPIQFVISADTTEIPQMPSEAAILEMQEERRRAAHEASLTIDAET